MPQATLITFPPSLDCELGRFLADHYGIDYEERRHALIFSSLVTLRYGATLLFPLLCSDTYRLDTARAIVEHFDPQSSDDRKLLGRGSDRTAIEADWEAFHGSLSFSTAIFAYYHLLPHRSIMIRPLSEGAPDFEVRAVRTAYPLFAGLLRLLLFLTAARAAQSLASARSMLAAVDQRLADGRSYLVGQRLSLSDVAFAVAAAPFVLPDLYGGPLPSFDEMPAAMRAVIVETRARPSGQFAQRIYHEYRSRSRGDPSMATGAAKTANGGSDHEMA